MMWSAEPSNSRQRGAVSQEPCVLIWSEVIRLTQAERKAVYTGGQAIGTDTTRSFASVELLASRKRAEARDPASQRTPDGVVVSPSCEGGSWRSLSLREGALAKPSVWRLRATPLAQNRTPQVDTNRCTTARSHSLSLSLTLSHPLSLTLSLTQQ